MYINKNIIAQRALEYQKQGYYLTPLAINSKVPVAGFNFRNTEALTANEVAKWWETEPYNIGLRTRGLLVIDIDTATGHSLALDGRQSILPYKELIQNTRLVSTPTGGLHVYFRYTGDLLRSGQWLEGVDVKTGENSYIVAPPSKMAKGEYRILSKDITIREAPQELIQAISIDMNKPVKVAKSIKYKHYEILTLNDLPDYAKAWINAGLGNNGNRNNSATKLIGRLLRYFSLEIAWNGLLEANKNTYNPLPEKELERVFRSITQKDKGVRYARK